MASAPVRLRPVRDNKSGVPDLQNIFYATPFLAKFYRYVQVMHMNKSVTNHCCKKEHVHPNYDLEVLRDTFLATFFTKDIVCPGRQASVRPTSPYLKPDWGIFPRRHKHQPGPRLERLQAREDLPHVHDERWVAALQAPATSPSQALPGAPLARGLSRLARPAQASGLPARHA